MIWGLLGRKEQAISTSATTTITTITVCSIYRVHVWVRFREESIHSLIRYHVSTLHQALS